MLHSFTADASSDRYVDPIASNTIAPAVGAQTNAGCFFEALHDVGAHQIIKSGEILTLQQVTVSWWPAPDSAMVGVEE